jgi:Meiotically up-regulated gene 113
MFIYVIGPIEGPQKIGLSGDVEKRLQTLQTGSPLDLQIHHKEPIGSKQVRNLEKKIHTELNHKRKRGEWFDLTPTEAKEFVIFFAIRYGEDPLLGL